MANTETFALSVVTPEQVVLDCAARFVAFPAHDGEVGILRDRAPLLCKMGIGPLRVESDTGETTTLFVDGGFAQVVANRLTILTEQAKSPADIDRPAVEQALVEARAQKITDPASFDARQKAIKRARVQLKLATPRS